MKNLIKYAKKDLKTVLFVFLIGITIFSLFSFLASLKEKRDLVNTIEGLNKQKADLENEKLGLQDSLNKQRQLNTGLTEENTGLKATLAESEARLARLDAEFKQALKKIDKINAEIAALENQRENLTLQLSQVTQERQDLKTKMGSIPDLKNLIRELKRKMHITSQQARQNINIRTKDKDIFGNQGFLVKHGKSTYPPKVKIEVIPASSR